MIRIAIIILFVSIIQLANAQFSLQSVLDSIAANNFQIRASSENRDAETAFALTGLNPLDPQVEYGYFPGNKGEIGTKTTLSISQSFYFPTVYTRKRTEANLSGEKSDELHNFNTRYILIEAASHYLELVYLHKYGIELKKRAAYAENVKALVEKRLQTGDANQLEVNKAIMEAMRWTNELSINTARRTEKEKLLIAMNGDRSFVFANPEYPL